MKCAKQQFRNVEFPLVAEHVRVGVGCHAQAALADVSIKLWSCDSASRARAAALACSMSEAARRSALWIFCHRFHSDAFNFDPSSRFHRGMHRTCKRDVYGHARSGSYAGFDLWTRPEMRLVGIEPTTSRSGGARSIP